MTRPRRALLEEPEDTEPVVRYIPRRSSGQVPVAERASLESEEDTHEVAEPAPKPRRAQPAPTDFPDPEGLAESGSLDVSLDVISEDPGEVPVAADFDDGPPTVALASGQTDAVSHRPVQEEASLPSPDSDDQPRPARALIEPQPQYDAGGEQAPNGWDHRPARAWVEPERTPPPRVRTAVERTPPAPVRTAVEPEPTPPAPVRTAVEPMSPTPAPSVPLPPVASWSPIPAVLPPPVAQHGPVLEPVAASFASPLPSPERTVGPSPVTKPMATTLSGPAAVALPRIEPADRWESAPPAAPVSLPSSISAQEAAPLRQAPPPRRSPAAVRRTVGHHVEPIVIDRLVKAYDGTLAVRNLSFVVEPGRITGFLGPNGAGKTTTLRILVGLVTPTTGTATFGGTRYADLAKPQETVGAVLEANFHPGRTGRNHLRVLAATAGVPDRRVDELLERVGLGDDGRRAVGQYSLGMRQRLALAAALIGDPDYLVLDEPANGLDPEGIRWLRNFLRDFAGTGRAVLVSSHQLNEVQATVDEIVVIHKGRLLAQMPMSDLQLGGGTTRVRAADLDTAARQLAPLQVRIERGHDDRGPYLRVHSQEVAAVGAALFDAGVVVNELVTERRDLEQEFFSMLESSR